MRRDVWSELPPHRYDKVWDAFCEVFKFRPSVNKEDWPSFQVPPPSATWRIRDLLEAFNPWNDPAAMPYNLALLNSLKAVVPRGEKILALDWQHICYEFLPHEVRRPRDQSSWLIPALPSGEYHMFVTSDFRLGSLGHPWEETVCVFGEGFLDVYQRLTPLLSSQLIRKSEIEPKPKMARRKR
jgi:hypothetical protein